jgi:hypothetical protein
MVICYYKVMSITLAPQQTGTDLSEFKYSHMKAYGGVVTKLHILLTSKLYGKRFRFRPL